MRTLVFNSVTGELLRVCYGSQLKRYLKILDNYGISYSTCTFKDDIDIMLVEKVTIYLSTHSSHEIYDDLFLLSFSDFVEKYIDNPSPGGG